MIIARHMFYYQDINITNAFEITSQFTDMDAEEAYEEMMREEREMAERRKRAEGDFSSPKTPHKSKTDMVETASPARPQSQPQNQTKSPGSNQPTKAGVCLLLL